jgi:hypothetical protein
MDSFLILPASERAQLIQEAATRHGHMSSQIVEKDLWVCWTLKQLYSIPELAQHLTFKGGTSLSKAYGLIDRFSEDIDLTIDKEYLGIDGNSWPKDISSRKARQEFRKILDKACVDIIAGKLLPLLKMHFSKILGDNKKDAYIWDINIAENDSLTIMFHYPRCINYGSAFFGSGNFGNGNFSAPSYIKPVVRLEFGAIGDSFPVASHSFIPYAAELIPEVFENPAGIKVTTSTLEAERTFWEKVTILHELYNREKDKPLKQAIARHYYDTVMLARKGVAAKALRQKDLLEAVVKNTKLNCTDSNDFSTYKAYDNLLKHEIKLAPPLKYLTHLQKDFADMQESGMFFGNFPSFEEIVQELGQLEKKLNKI